MKSPLDLNDPRLTAYALGEMPPPEQAAFELLLQTDPAAQRLVQEIRDTAGTLSAALELEPAPARCIEPPLAHPPTARRRSWWRESWTLWAPLGAAATFAVYYHFDVAAPRPASPTGESVAAQPVAPASATPPSALPAPATDSAANPAPTAVAASDATNPAPLSTVPASAAVPTVAATPVAPTPGPTAPTVAPEPLVLPRVESLSTESLALFPRPSFEVRPGGADAGVTAETSRVQLAGLGNRTTYIPSLDRNTATLGRIAPPLSYESRAGETAAPRSRAVLAPRATAGGRRVPVARAATTPTTAPARPALAADPAAKPAPLRGGFVPTLEQPASTIPATVGGGSMNLVRQALRQNLWPAVEDVRIEELLNWFPAPARPHAGDAAVQIRSELHPAPWNGERLLLRLAVRPVAPLETSRPAVNLVFLVDTSASFQRDGRLDLLREMIARLALRLTPRDRIALVAYGESGGVLLPSTAVEHPGVVHDALARLGARGEGRPAPLRLPQAYEAARAGFLADGVNRVVWCTDSDRAIEFSSPVELRRYLAAQTPSGIALSALSLGADEQADAALDEITAAGGGVARRVASPADVRRFLVEQFAGTFDLARRLAGVEVEFNPATVAAHRLLGFEGADGTAPAADADRSALQPLRSLTAIYEIIPLTGPDTITATEWGRVRVRTAPALGAEPVTTEHAIVRRLAPADATVDFQFGAAIAGFGMLIGEVPERGTLDWRLVEQLARAGLGNDDGGHRAEFLALVQRARRISPAK